MLSDTVIRSLLQRGQIEIVDTAPYERELLIQPASVDLRLAADYLVMRTHRMGFIDPAEDQRDVLYELCHAGGPGSPHFFVHPGEFVVASTVERVRLDRDVVGRVEGKSSLGRLGLMVHSTAGFIDPGFEGTVTLEIANVSPLPIKLYADMPVCQIAFDFLSGKSSGYAGKYNGQVGPKPSEYFRNFRRGGPAEYIYQD